VAGHEMADNQHPRTSLPNATLSPIGNHHDADPRPRRDQRAKPVLCESQPEQQRQHTTSAEPRTSPTIRKVG